MADNSHEGKATSKWLQEWEENWGRASKGDRSNSRMEYSSDRLISIESDYGTIPYEHSQAAIAHAKHKLIDALMRDVYSMVGTQWSAAIRACVAPESERADGHSQISQSHGKKSRDDGKKRKPSRKPSPPGDDNGRRTKGDVSIVEKRPKIPLFACPFNKNNPGKYRVNDESGLRYRSCAAAPGLKGINRVK